MEDNLYIIFSKTHTKIGKFIRIITRHEYNHVSLATSSSLVPLFSFARRRVDKPFSGGFVEESWLRYLYQNMDVKVRVYKIPLAWDRAKEIEDLLQFFRENKNCFGYDFKGLVLNRENQNNYTCLSFVQAIISKAIPMDRKFKRINELMNFLEEYFHEEKVIYNREKKKFSWGNDSFDSRM